LERQSAIDVLNKANKKPLTFHKRIRKKRFAISVATLKVPLLANMGSGDDIVDLNYNIKDDKNWRVNAVDSGKSFDHFMFIYQTICVYI
jgi:hypothetical protein